jgi:basic membrane protein A
MKKRILALLLAGVLAVGLTACGSTDTTDADTDTDATEATETTDAAAASDLKVGLILVGEAADAYNKNHIEGMQAACEALGLDYDTQVIVKANVTEDSTCADAIYELIDAGCNAIFADSFGHEQYMVEIAPEYPDVQFCHATGYQSATDDLDNTHNYFAEIYQARYLAGIAAGLKTETNVLGYVAAKPYAEVISGYTAFYLGAKSVNPDVTMLVNYTNEWSDSVKEATNAQALIDQGCDVISQHSDTSAPATTAQAAGVYAVGYNDDMIAVAPDAALVSARINWGVYYEYALNCLLTGEEIAQDWCGSYADGACYLSDLNTDVVADGTAEAIEAAAAGIIDGSVQVFAGPLHGVDADGNELNLAEGEYYTENETSSSPSFAYIIDGITVLS